MRSMSMTSQSCDEKPGAVSLLSANLSLSLSLYCDSLIIGCVLQRLLFCVQSDFPYNFIGIQLTFNKKVV